MPIEYSEYKSLVETLQKSDEFTYEELMKKEKDVLDTVNKTVRHIQDNSYKQGQFVNMQLSHIFERFFLIWPEIIRDLNDAPPERLFYELTKDDRVIYYGLMMLVIALFMFVISASDKITPVKVNGP